MDAPPLTLSVILPARNEQDCLGDCLRSLVSQQEDQWRLGENWEILVVDDGSTDRTREIAAEFASQSSGVTVLEAPRLEKGWTGKNNACWAGAQAARGTWLLFTDADTIHEPGHLRLAIVEAERHEAGMLSYSPRQIVRGLAQRALMPLVFSDLAATYSPTRVNDPAQRVAAANGQFLLVRRDVYDKIGGHAAVKGAILEDVELASLAKRGKAGLRFRNAPEAVATRMYRSFGAMVEGWTKNLALLFGNAPMLAATRLLQLAVLVGVPVLMWFLWWVRTSGRMVNPGVLGTPMATAALALVWVRALWGVYARVAKSGFPWRDCVLAPLGIPLYAVLLWRSWFRVTVLKQVVWKGREVKAG
ncbi:MAG TPA: glycosyltransferase family 2 protein [Acidobacteriaceae bacterium]|nr:glycosyltransferase family 2 protein [Acidobacteriaceae bacterium]